MKDKLLTLAVPTFNMERYLARCLESVLCENQDYLEVLVVNDGSKDRSLEIGREYETKYPDVIRVIDKENGNYGSCVNRAIAEAKGKYFRMLDADDWCNTAALNQWLENLKTCDADMVLTISEDRGEDGSLIGRMSAPETMPDGVIVSADEFDADKLGYRYLFCSHVVTYKMAILRTINLQLQTGISYTDNEYVFFPLDHIRSVVYYDLPVYQYFVGREGQTTSPDQMMKCANQMQQVVERMMQYFLAHRTEQTESVLSNQRHVLFTVASWLYGPLFCKPYTKEKMQQIRVLDSILKQDDTLYASMGKRIPMLAFYRRTNLYLTSPVARLYFIGRKYLLRLLRKTYRMIK